VGFKATEVVRCDRAFVAHGSPRVYMTERFLCRGPLQAADGLLSRWAATATVFEPPEDVDVAQLYVSIPLFWESGPGGDEV